MDGTAPRIVLAIAFIGGVAAFLITLFVAAPPRRVVTTPFAGEVRAAFVEEDWDTVIELAGSYLEAHRAHPEALFFLGEGYLRRDRAGDAQEAERTWNRLVAATHGLPLDPRELPEGLWAGDALWRGWALDRLGRTEEAHQAWADGADAISSLRRGRSNRGNLRLTAMLGLTGRADEAWPYLRFVSANGSGSTGLSPLWADTDPTLAPLRADPLFNLITDWSPSRFGQAARRLMATGSLTSLARLARLETRIDPSHAEAWLFQGFALERLGEDAEQAWCGLAHAVMLQTGLTNGGQPDCAGAIETLAAQPDLVLGSGYASFAGWALRQHGHDDAARQIWLTLGDGMVTGSRPSNATDMYNAACYYSLAGELDTAVYWLDRAVDAGYRDHAWGAVDPDLDPIRDHPAYEAALTLEKRVPRPAGVPG